MKPLLYFLAFILLGCTSKPEKKGDDAHQDSIKKMVQKMISDSSHFIDNDYKKRVNDSLEAIKEKELAKGKKIVIWTEGKSKVTYTQRQLNDILKNYGELDHEYPYDPDMCYQKRGDNFESHRNDQYDCCACAEEYYVLYAYFLRQKLNPDTFEVQRKTLIKIYRQLNDIFEILNHGGSGFGHLYMQIVAYAEYDIYCNKGENGNKYDITKQKQLFVNSLRQYVKDEFTIDAGPRINNESGKEDLRNFYSMINKLDKLLTNYFYLSCARKFMYKHYCI